MDFKGKMDKYIIVVAVELLTIIVLAGIIHEFESRRIVMLIIDVIVIVGGIYILTVSVAASEQVHTQLADVVPIKIQINKTILLTGARVIIVLLANAIIIAVGDMLYQREDGIKMNRGAFLLLLLLPTIVYAAYSVRAAIAEVRKIKNGSDDLK